MSRGKGHVQWSKAVRERMPRCAFCGSTENLHAHHVLMWEKFPEHRFDIANGLTACESCHNKIHTPGGGYGNKILRKRGH